MLGQGAGSSFLEVAGALVADVRARWDTGQEAPDTPAPEPGAGRGGCGRAGCEDEGSLG